MNTPAATRCPQCGTLAAEWICHVCKFVKHPHPGDRIAFLASMPVVVGVIAATILERIG